MKTVCMIPARLGSSRVKKKNLRYLGDRPLVAHVISTCVKSGLFDEVYLNSEAEVFEDIAHKYGAKFFKRSSDLATAQATNDQFVEDFFNKVDCENLVQVNPTGPFIQKEDLESIVNLLKEGCETVQTLKEERIEGIFKGQALNYDPMKAMPPSQDLEPIQLYSSAAMGFNKKRFLSNMQELGAATYGGSGKIGYHVMTGYSNIDIDYEDDFRLAEVVYKMISTEKKEPARYYDEEMKKASLKSDYERELILDRDGVDVRNLKDYNKELVTVKNIIDKYGRTSSWCHSLVDSPSNTSTLIGQMPGEGNRMHFHPEWDEWWYIVEGRWEWHVDGKNMEVKAGDLVFIERNRKHKITAIGNEMAVRMAVSRADVVHVYEDEDY
jgi:CMP-N-acetylneuraminic acid synthetase/quercetin dioxygenase-like cupin family protein